MFRLQPFPGPALLLWARSTPAAHGYANRLSVYTAVHIKAREYPGQNVPFFLCVLRILRYYLKKVGRGRLLLMLWHEHLGKKKDLPVMLTITSRVVYAGEF